MSLLDILTPAARQIRPGLVHLQRCASQDMVTAALAVLEAAPPRSMITPWGKPMSVAITNCGQLGWITDRSGYRYAALDPATGQPWPAMPDPLRDLARQAAEMAGFRDFNPDACLINLYEADAKMGLHQDKDEMDFSQPIVSVSLGMSAIFRFGGATRRDPAIRLQLDHGDVVVFGGPGRRAFHGLDRLIGPAHSLLGSRRINLTFRKAA